MTQQLVVHMKRFRFPGLALISILAASVVAACSSSGNSGGDGPKCGDHQIGAGEGGDDRTTTDGDGSAAPCRGEAAFACDSGRKAPGEACDDANMASGDGCSATCVR